MKDLKSLFESYQKPVSESGWESITNDSKVVRFNKMRHIKRIATYSIGGLLTAAAITTAILLALQEQKDEPTSAATISKLANNAPSQATKANTVSHQTTGYSHQVSSPSNNSTSILIDNGPIDLKSDITTPAAPKQNLPIAQNLSNSSVTNSEKPLFIAPKSTRNSVIGNILSQTEIPQVSMPEQSIEEMTVVTESSTHFVPKNAKEDELPESFWAPNAFTPNGDGVNERFRVYVNSNDYAENSDSSRNIDMSTFELNIFSRNGQLVFHTRNIEEEWNGTVQNSGTRLEPGVYVYTVRFAINKKIKYKKGTVTILK